MNGRKASWKVSFCVLPGIITESQHGRGWQGPLWVTQSNPLPKQGHPEQAAQDLVQVGLEYLQEQEGHVRNKQSKQPRRGVLHRFN